MMPAGYLSFRFIEAPFLRLRKRYLVAEAAGPDRPGNAATQDAPGDAPASAPGLDVRRAP